MCLCVSDHYMQVLNCKQHCAVELASVPSGDKPFEDFLPSHFNYLQFSYYNSESHSLFFSACAEEWPQTLSNVLGYNGSGIKPYMYRGVQHH